MEDRIWTLTTVKTVEICTIWPWQPATCSCSPIWEGLRTFSKISTRICTSTLRINYSTRAKRMAQESMGSRIVRQISRSPMINGIRLILNRFKSHSQNKVRLNRRIDWLMKTSWWKIKMSLRRRNESLGLSEINRTTTLKCQPTSRLWIILS